MNTDMTHKITKEQYRQLQEWRVLTRVLSNSIEDYFNKAKEITKESDEGGYTFDYIYNGDWSVDELLKMLKIKVQK